MASTNQSGKKRPRTSWKDLPAFLDASASVSATTFGARRLPEIKSLWNAQSTSSGSVFSVNDLQSGGGKTSARHLRRRTTSHLSRKRHRYPQGKSSAENSLDTKVSKLPSRRSRRKPVLLQHEHDSWRRQQDDSVNNNNNGKAHWMMTHLWHAKRFQMHDCLFGWKIPLLHSNRGARAALRLAKEGRTLLQDVTWRMQPLLIGAPSLNVLAPLLQRMCPSFLPSDKAKAILSRNSMGEGMLHELDQFPAGALGPATWLISRRPMKTDAEKKVMWCAHFFVHPSIRPKVERLLTELSSSLAGPFSCDGGIACLQLRGRTANELLDRTLHLSGRSIATGKNLLYDWEKIRGGKDIAQVLPHLACILVYVHTSAEKLSTQKATQNESEDVSAYLKSFQENLASLDISTLGEVQLIGDEAILLVAQCPCDPSVAANAAICGWDIFCSPSIAREIFCALNQEGACSIGIVEEAHLRMESEPPLPVFPRDYPDTFDGREWWTSGESEWSLFRHYLGEGWGRVSREVSGFSKISWSAISNLQANVDDAGSVVVVRGEFGNPFLDVLSRSGHIPRLQAAKHARRNRRPARPASATVSLLPLSEEEAAAHDDMCRILQESLSLPALIRCSLRLEGKGRILPGCNIMAVGYDDASQGSPDDKTDLLLGMAVAGRFSPARGCVHGVGFVGAARLLEMMQSSSATVAVYKLDGEREAQVKVKLRSPPGEQQSLDRLATLSLLL